MKKIELIVAALSILFVMALTACSDSQKPTQEKVAQVLTTPETHVEEENHTEAQTAEDDAHAVVEAAEDEHAEAQGVGDEHSVQGMAEGLALFQSVGCAGCHGQNGEGGIGPAMAGHTAEQIRRQVRTPSGDVMPAFSEEQLSDDQLSVIIAWVESLGPATGDHDHAHEAEASEETEDHEHEVGEEAEDHEHEASEANEEAEDHEREAGKEDHEHVEEPAEQASSEPEQTVDAAIHLRLAFFAVLDDNAHDAEHHLEDLLALTEDEHAKAQIEEIVTKIQAGADAHDLEHEIEHLMEDLDPQNVLGTGPDFHLQLVQDSLTLNDLEAAGHHLEHFAGLVDDDDLATTARELIAHLENGDLHTVEAGVQALRIRQGGEHQD